MVLMPPDMCLPALGWLLFPLLYVELHYRLLLPGLSRYYRREPEILADLASRIAPGRRPPLLLLVKDAHRYPIRLERVEVGLDTGTGPSPWTTLKIGEDITAPWWHRIIELDRPEATGYVKWWVILYYRSRGRGKHGTTHNLPGLPSRPLQTYLATDPLPGPGVVWGDLHHHTSLTEDMIEYGAPLEATRAAATALGLGFVALTDHSYDLDDQPGSWRRTDPTLAKWHTSRQRIEELNNETNGALLLPGEEVSVRNSRGRNVHALVLGHPDFLPGTGDGGEGSLRRRSELDLPALARQVPAAGLVIAAHPLQPVPWLQRFVVRRDTWSHGDTAHDGITGLQILNGRFDRGFEQGLRAWQRLLLEGRRVFIYAGSDSHGDFNHFRTIGQPFVNLAERDGSTLGGCRTGLLDPAPGDQPAIMAALRAGRCLISNGPFIDLVVTNGETAAGPGDSLPGGDLEVRLRLSSTPEFGPLTRLRLYQGILGTNRERLLVDRILGTGRYDYQWRHRLNITEPAYLRAEAQSRLPDGNVFGNRRGRALTNPVWAGGE